LLKGSGPLGACWAASGAAANTASNAMVTRVRRTGE
jgi:hypothetical protein